MTLSHSPANNAAAVLLVVVAFVVIAVFTRSALYEDAGRNRARWRSERLCTFHWHHAHTPNDTLAALRECPLPEKKS